MSARYWIGTLYDWTVPLELPNHCIWLRGQQERCPTTERLHHQVLAAFSGPQRLAAVKRLIGTGHWEPTRSEAAIAYVHKEDTAVENTRFELGARGLRRNSATDWGQILCDAKRGDFDNIPADVQVRYYRTLKAISADFAIPVGVEKVINVFYGATGTGKSRRAWAEAGLDAFPKDPRSKWWDGYQAEKKVVIGIFF